MIAFRYISAAWLIAGSSVAHAQLTACNETQDVVNVAITILEDNVWKGKGWVIVKPGDCGALTDKPMQNRYFGIYAISPKREWAGNSEACVRSKSSFDEADSNVCAYADAVKIKMMQVDAGDQPSYRFALKDSRTAVQQVGTSTPVQGSPLPASSSSNEYVRRCESMASRRVAPFIKNIPLEALAVCAKAAEEAPSSSGNYLYARTLDRHKRFVDAVNQYQRAAAAGDTQSQEALSAIYRDTDKELRSKVPNDLLKSNKFALMAVASGSQDPDTTAQAAYAYLFGPGVTQNSREAIRLTLRARELGFKDVITGDWLCKAYVFPGFGVGDYRRGLPYCREAAEAGDADSMLNMGWLYHDGLGVEANQRISDQWYRKAAALGNKDAIEFLRSRRKVAVVPDDPVVRTQTCRTIVDSYNPSGPSLTHMECN